MVKIDQREADYLIAHVKTRKLVKASERKIHGGKTYYIKNDDMDSLKTIAMLRGYKPTRKTVVLDNGKQKEIEKSPAEQLLEDN